MQSASPQDEDTAGPPTFFPMMPDPPAIPFTAEEATKINEQLAQRLGPEWISSRPGPGGGKLHYLPGENAILLANEIFGFNGWSLSIRKSHMTHCDGSGGDKFNVGFNVAVRIRLKDGTSREDIGYGISDNTKGRGAAIQKAQKSAVTDGLKRALRLFGNVFGLCLHDKQYVANLKKMKALPRKWEPEKLRRHAEYANPRKGLTLESEDSRILDDTVDVQGIEVEDDFGYSEFDDADFDVEEMVHVDEADSTTALVRNPIPTMQKTNSIPNQPPSTRFPSDPPAARLHGAPSIVAQPNLQRNSPAPGNPGNSVYRPGAGVQGGNSTYPSSRFGPGNAPQHRIQAQTGPTKTPSHPGAMNPPQARSFPQPPDIRQSHPLQAASTEAQDLPKSNTSTSLPSFYTARAAESVQTATSAPPIFDPKAESPSIRKTPGIDHDKTTPLRRDLVGPAGGNSMHRSNPMSPKPDPGRRVGAPTSVPSPLQNRGSYRPPQMVKRPGEGATQPGIARVPLDDVTGAAGNRATDGPGDAKRVKLNNGAVATNGGAATIVP